VLDGAYEEDRAGGGLAVKGQYAGGRRVGTWTWYDDQARVTRSEAY
jgi:hypothetical protein